MIRKQNDIRLFILTLLVFTVLFFTGGCSAGEESNESREEEILQQTVLLPPLESVQPDDPYLFIPLASAGFKINFAQAVDLTLVEQAVSFDPALDFSVLDARGEPGHIWLLFQEKPRSDTIYTLRIRDVQDESSGEPETFEVTFRTEFQGERQIADPQWSHDGEELAYLVRPEGSDVAELWKVNLKDGNEQLLAGGLSWPNRVSWSPDDSTILFTKMIAVSEQSWSLPEVWSVDRAGREEKVIVSAEDLDEISRYGPLNIYCWYSPDGKKIALQLDLAREDSHSDLHRSLAVVKSDGSGLRLVDGHIFAGWQNNDTLMVLKTHEGYNHSRTYRYDLFLAGADGEVPARLLLGEGQIPNFERAGQSSDLNILVIGEWEAIYTGFDFKDEGTGFLHYDLVQNSLTPFGLEDGYQKHPAVSPQGGEIIFTANKDGNWNLYVYENATIRQLTADHAHELYPAWSPAGDKLALVSTRSGTEEIWLLELSSGNLEQLTGL